MHARPPDLARASPRDTPRDTPRGTPRTPPRSEGGDRETAHNIAMAKAGSPRTRQEITMAVLEQSGDDSI